MNPHDFYRSMPRDWEPVTPPIHPECKVSVTDAAGKRWTMTVRADSLYGAIFAYAARQSSGHESERACPKPEWDTIFEVEAPDGRVFKRTYGQAKDWANRQARGEFVKHSH